MVSFGFRGWMEHGSEPAQLALCEIPRSAAAVHWARTLFSGGSPSSQRAAELARRAGSRVVSTGEVILYDGGVVHGSFFDSNELMDCGIYIMSLATCEPWGPGGTWEGPDPEDPTDPDGDFVLYPDAPFYYEGDALVYQPVIRCTGTTDRAHLSHHVPGTVNVEGHTRCTGPVPSLSVTVKLQRQRCWLIFCSCSTVAISAPATASGVRVKTNAAAICFTGWWRGQSHHAVTFPPGYWSVGSYLPSSSPTAIRIQC